MFQDLDGHARPMTAYEKGYTYAFKLMRPPFELIFFQLDMTKPLALIKEYRDATGLRCTPTVFFIKASALALKEAPQLIDMMHWGRVIRPSTIDIGVSVAGKANVAPVAVIRDTGGKGLEEISESLRTESQRVLEEEKRTMALADRWGRFLPFFLVRPLMRIVLSTYAYTRKNVGTFQLSNLGPDCGDLPFTSIFARSLLLAGSINERPVAVDGRDVARPTCYLSLHADHRTCDGARMGLFIKEFLRIAEQSPGEVWER